MCCSVFVDCCGLCVVCCWLLFIVNVCFCCNVLSRVIVGCWLQVLGRLMFLVSCFLLLASCFWFDVRGLFFVACG